MKHSVVSSAPRFSCTKKTAAQIIRGELSDCEDLFPGRFVAREIFQTREQGWFFIEVRWWFWASPPCSDRRSSKVIYPGTRRRQTLKIIKFINIENCTINIKKLEIKRFQKVCYFFRATEILIVTFEIIIVIFLLFLGNNVRRTMWKKFKSILFEILVQNMELCRKISDVPRVIGIFLLKLRTLKERCKMSQ